MTFSSSSSSVSALSLGSLMKLSMVLHVKRDTKPQTSAINTLILIEQARKRIYPARTYDGKMAEMVDY